MTLYRSFCVGYVHSFSTLLAIDYVPSTVLSTKNTKVWKPCFLGFYVTVWEITQVNVGLTAQSSIDRHAMRHQMKGLEKIS